MKTAFLFPGQGAQSPGMAKDLFDKSQQVRSLFELASEVAQKDMAKLLFEGSEEDLKSTDNTQIAMTLANISAALVLKEEGILPDMCAGFSVGEYAALWQAGVLDETSVFKAIIARGKAMETASRLLDKPEGNPGMSAILGLSFEEAAPVVQAIGGGKIFVANHSSPTQIVIAGTALGLEEAEAQLEKAGAMKIVRLKVSGPFHSPLLNSAKDEFAQAIASLEWKNPSIPLISNVNAQVLASGDQAKEFACQQIVSMVRWVDSMKLMKENQASKVLEVGPGRVLSGLWKSFTKEIKCVPAGTLEAIQSLGMN